MQAIQAEDTIEVEYVGDPNPLDDVVKMRIAMGHIPESAANVIRSASLRRSKAVVNVNRRLVEPEHFGTSKTYTFGPKVFKQRVLKRDYEKMKQSTSGHQFRAVGDPMGNMILPRDGEEGIVMVSRVELGTDQAVELVQQSMKKRR